MFGTIMAANVWMRIWPNQRKIIAAAKAGTPPPDGVAPLAGLRSKHNTYMSVPLIFFMISNHFPTVYGSDLRWIIAAGDRRRRLGHDQAHVQQVGQRSPRAVLVVPDWIHRELASFLWLKKTKPPFLPTSLCQSPD